MLKSLWRWVQRDRTFALLAGGILVMGGILFGLIVFLYNPPTSNPPAIHLQPTNAPGVAAPVAISPNLEAQTSTQVSPEVSTDGPGPTSGGSFEPATPIIVQPNPTQIANLPNQGQNPAPPPPPNFVSEAQPSKVSSPTPTPLPISKPTPKPTLKPTVKR